MKIYLVGGAVRDRLLNYAVKERDWVVVGASPEDLLTLGYRQVGRDFPVFLHPKTKEEYALARKERKTGKGYYGFECESSKQVTLEEDLMRRDLTINAIATDEFGNLIDPFHGLEDLQKKLLRHVSPAFAEDPVRVLRVARFAARYHHLGFKVAAETNHLMYLMVKNGELQHLLAERVWQEFASSLKEKNPEIFISTLRACDALSQIFPEINLLFGVPNPAVHHPEIDSGIHTLFTLKAAVILSTEPMLRFAALVHDLGKAQTPLNQWPSHHGHEERGVDIIDKFCKRLRVPTAWRKFAIMVSRHHLHIHRIAEMKASTIVRILEETDAFRRPKLFEQLLLVCEADACGKGENLKISYHQADKWRYIITECNKISVQSIISQGYKGKDIKQELTLSRKACSQLILDFWKLNEK